MATHKLRNLTGLKLKFQVGNTTIKVDPHGEFLVNLKKLEHVKKAVMRRALKILPKLHPGKVEVIDLEKEKEET